MPALLNPWYVEARARAWRKLSREPTTHDAIVPYDVPRSGGAQHPWNERQALISWHKDLEASGVPPPASGPRRLHSTRHTVITRMIRAGADWRAINLITHAGWGDSSTFRGYVHLGIREGVHLEWSDLCEAVGKLQLRLRQGR